MQKIGATIKDCREHVAVLLQSLDHMENYDGARNPEASFADASRVVAMAFFIQCSMAPVMNHYNVQLAKRAAAARKAVK